MTKRAIILDPKTYKPALDVEGVYVVELASDEDTKGQEFTFQYGESGEGAPRHNHEWDEAFFIVKGSATFTCGDIEKICTPGSFIFVPGGTLHSFTFGPDGCEMLDVTGVGSKALPMFRRIAEEYEKSKNTES